MNWRPQRMAALLIALAGCSEDPASPGPEYPPPDPVAIEFPIGFPEPVIPADNPTTRQGIELGRRLFYDSRLSEDSTQACASCHIQRFAFADTLKRSIGVRGMEVRRHSPSLNNVALLPLMFWDGHATSLEHQATFPVPDPLEMDLPWAEAVARLSATPEYEDMFGRAFGDGTVTQDRVVKAIAQFQRTFITLNSKFDRFLAGDGDLTRQELSGFGLFSNETGDCHHCHLRNTLTDNLFHDIGLDAIYVDPGLGEVTTDPADNGKFKTPSLRNVAVSAPYMHDGRFETLEEVLAHYNHGFHDSPNLSPLIRARRASPPLTPEQISDIIAFLNTLTDESFLQSPELSNPFEP